MIHKYKLMGLNIVLDVYSGAVHLVDDIFFDLIDGIGESFDKNGDYSDLIAKLSEKYPAEDVKDTFAELKRLAEEEQLYTDDFYAELAAKWNKKSVVKALCLHIAHDCNLRCKYCFADGGEYKGGHRALMSAEVGKAAIDFVIKNSGSRHNIEIDYFGGEPLMNFGVVKEITEYAKEQGKIHDKNFRFTITTNGILLNDDVKAYVNENMSNIVLSLDGTKATNDRMRVRVDGSGSYDAIVPKFIDIAESRNQDNYYVRGTFTAENLHFADDVMHMADLGFLQTSVEPVVAPVTESYALTDEHIETVCKEYEKLAELYIQRRRDGKPFNFFHFMIDLEQGPCVVKRLSGCGAGHEYIAVTPEGDIYPCHQFVGNTDFKMGSVMTGEFDEEIKSTFEKSNIYTKPKCADCFAKFYCSGGCAANAYNFNKDINEPYNLACEFERKRVECAIAIEAIKALEGLN